MSHWLSYANGLLCERMARTNRPGPITKRLHTVVETPEFRSRADEVMSDGERSEFVDFVAANPEAGEKIRGTGGARKVRWATGGRGKSGGVRVITFYSGPPVPVFLLTVFGKGQKSNITAREARELRRILKQLVEEYRSPPRKGARRK